MDRIQVLKDSLNHCTIILDENIKLKKENELLHAELNEQLEKYNHMNLYLNNKIKQLSSQITELELERSKPVKCFGFL
jgi:hypothetical protein